MTWFSRRKEEWFSCHQFDAVANRMGAVLADGRRYRFGSRLGVKAMYDFRTRTIRFDKKWFYERSPKARCAVLAHELWHCKTWEKVKRANRSYRIDLFLRSFVYAVILAVIAFIAMDTYFHFRFGLYEAPSDVPGLIILFWLLAFFIRWVDGGLFKKYSWPLEYESDEASVRFIGLDATKEVIESLRARWNTFTHPSHTLRLAHAEEVAAKNPVPIIDWESLNQEIMQEIIVLGES